MILSRFIPFLPIFLFLTALNCLPVITNEDSPAPSSTPPAKTIPSGWQHDFTERVNQLRRSGCKCGGRNMPPVPALTWNEHLAAAARRHVRDMARNERLEHTGSDGSTIADRATAAGYAWRAIAENIALGYDDPVSVVNGWLKSPGHCRNMMNAAYRDMGAANQDGYWVQTLGRRQ